MASLLDRLCIHPPMHSIFHTKPLAPAPHAHALRSASYGKLAQMGLAVRERPHGLRTPRLRGVAVAAGRQVGCQSSEVEQRAYLKRQLLQLLSVFDIKSTNAMVEALITLNPTPEPLARPDLLHRAWRLLSTDSASILTGKQDLSRFSFGKFPACMVDVAKIVQIIEPSPDGLCLANVAILQLGNAGAGMYEMRATACQELPATLNLQFQEIVFYPIGNCSRVVWRELLALGSDASEQLQADIQLHTANHTVYLDEELRIVASASGYTVTWVDDDPRPKR